jgi:hypothetical protein
MSTIDPNQFSKNSFEYAVFTLNQRMSQLNWSIYEKFSNNLQGQYERLDISVDKYKESMFEFWRKFNPQSINQTTIFTLSLNSGSRSRITL